ncbi:unnamed protein product [Victoria cruziana]
MLVEFEIFLLITQLVDRGIRFEVEPFTEQILSHARVYPRNLRELGQPTFMVFTRIDFVDGLGQIKSTWSKENNRSRQVILRGVVESYDFYNGSHKSDLRWF